MAKKEIPFEVKIDEIMEQRQSLLSMIDMESKPFSEKIADLQSKIDEINKEKDEHLSQLNYQLKACESKIEEIMKENGLNEFLHKYNKISYKGVRSVNVEVAKVLLKPDVFKAIVKETITVEKLTAVVSDPDELKKMLVEGEKKLSFLKPEKAKRGSSSEKNGIKSVIK